MTEKTFRHKILVVDDEEKNLSLMELLLRGKGYALETAQSGTEALEKVKSFSPDLILLDIMMPGIDGYEVCKRLKREPATQNIPVVMVTALADMESKIEGLTAGASEFLTKPIDETEVIVRTENLLRVKEYEDFLANHNRILTAEVADKTKELREAYVDTILRLTIVAEHKDEDTASHIRRISHYCSFLAKSLGYSEEDSEIVFYATPMHDIGKVAIPSEILLKPARLTPEEFMLMKTHTTTGARVLSGSKSRFLQMAEGIALTHHERWDGGGYPKGLKGDAIPLEGRIMNIADQYDAMRSRRPYKPPFDHEKTFKIITEGDGRTMPEHFDPQVLNSFRENHKKFEEIFDSHKD